MSRCLKESQPKAVTWFQKETSSWLRGFDVELPGADSRHAHLSRKVSWGLKTHCAAHKWPPCQLWRAEEKKNGHASWTRMKEVMWQGKSGRGHQTSGHSCLLHTRSSSIQTLGWVVCGDREKESARNRLLCFPTFPWPQQTISRLRMMPVLLPAPLWLWVLDAWQGCQSKKSGRGLDRRNEKKLSEFSVQRTRRFDVFDPLFNAFFEPTAVIQPELPKVVQKIGTYQNLLMQSQNLAKLETDLQVVDQLVRLMDWSMTKDPSLKHPTSYNFHDLIERKDAASSAQDSWRKEDVAVIVCCH